MAYHQIFEGIITGVASSSIFETVRYAVQEYFGTRRESNDRDDENIFSIPLAINYYYNLIEKIEDSMISNNLLVQSHLVEKNDTVLKRMDLTEEQLNKLSDDELNQFKNQRFEKTQFLGNFEIKDVSLEIIYPTDLSNRSTKNCSSFLFNNTNKGSIPPTAKGGRPYGINYLQKENEIKIIDYVRPIEAISKFYKEIRGIGGLGDISDEWKRIEELEMQAFLYTLKLLIEEKSNFFYDKVYYKPINAMG